MISSGLRQEKKDERDIKLGALITLPKLEELPEEYMLEYLEVQDQEDTDFCFYGKTKVLMEDFTYKNIENIKEGEFVITKDSNVRRVNKKLKRIWQGNSVKIDIKGDFRTIETTPSHPFFAIKRRIKNYGSTGIKGFISKKQIEEVKAEDLRVGDFVVQPKIKTIIRDTTLNAYERDPEFLWVLGMYLAEGHIDEYRVAFSLHYKEINFANRIKNVMERYGATVSINRYKHLTTTKVYISGGNSFHKSNWVSIFHELGNKICNHKRINRRLMCIEPKLQMNIVRGVFDGDGTKGKKRKVIGMTSLNLLEQIKIILARNDIHSFLHKVKEKKDRLQSYYLEWSYNKNKGVNYGEDENYFYARINKIEKKQFRPNGTVYNLEVEDDKTYIVNNSAVHNCSAYSTCAISSIQEGFVLDPLYSFAVSKSLSGNEEEWGQTFSYALKGHVKVGAIGKVFAPFTIKDKDKVRYLKNFPNLNDLYQIAIGQRKKAYVEISGKYDHYDNVRATLWKYRDEKRGAVMGLDWHWNIYDYVLNGIDDGFGHMIAIIGWNKDGLILLNSAGLQAGKQGKHVLPREEANYYIKKYNGAFTFIDLSPDELRKALESGKMIDESVVNKLQKLLIKLLQSHVALLIKQITGNVGGIISATFSKKQD